MANLEKTEWGYSVEILRDAYHRGRRIEIAGGNMIKPFEMVSLHIHHDNNEDYIPQREGMKILVVPAADAETLTEEDILERFAHMDSVPVGEIVTCHKGEAHALYNDSSEYGAWMFIKYQ